jgi:protein-tyrosine phosphatase
VAESTHIPLEGALNLRDLGGYQADGGHFRRGIVFRSDNLNTLTDADLAKIDGLGIRSVFDFRGPREIEQQPSRLWSSVSNHVSLPITGDTVQEKTFIERVLAGELTEVRVDEVGANYVTILEDRGDRFAHVLTSIAAEDHSPILFHCTAGKDRTGLAAALIHGLCGVSREDIVHDYGLSDKYRLGPRKAELTAQFEPHGIDIEPLIPGISAPIEAMQMALDHLESQHGGIRAYVIKSLGVDERTVDNIRKVLID